MRIQSLVLGCLIGFCVAGPELGAQGGLREGVRVRVEAPGAPRVTGVVHAVTPDSIVLFAEPGATRLGIPRSAISRLEVSQGRSASDGAKKGALWGGGIFGGLGLIMAALIDSDTSNPTNDQYGSSGFTSPYAVAVLIGAEGAGIGAIIGGFVKSEKWDTVNVRPMVGMGVNGLKLGFSLR